MHLLQGRSGRLPNTATAPGAHVPSTAPVNSGRSFPYTARAVIPNIRCDASGRLFDEFGGINVENPRQGSETKRLGGRDVDDELECGRLLDRDIAGLRAVENLVHKLGCATEHIGEVWSVGHETASLDEIAGTEHRRQPRVERRRDDVP